MLWSECSSRKLHIRDKKLIDLYYKHRKHDSPVKVPQIYKLEQQMCQWEQQAGNVNAAWENCETEDKQQASLDDRSVWNEKPASTRLPLHGRQHQKMLHHTASRSTAWWTQSLTLLPQETIPEGHGWGILARVTEGGVRVQLLAQNPCSNQQDSASRGCHASPLRSTHRTNEKQSPGKGSRFSRSKAAWKGNESRKKRIKGPACMRGPNFWSCWAALESFIAEAKESSA